MKLVLAKEEGEEKDVFKKKQIIKKKKRPKKSFIGVDYEKKTVCKLTI